MGNLHVRRQLSEWEAEIICPWRLYSRRIRRTPMALTTKNLSNNGATAHYKFQYDDSLAAPINPGGPESARTNAVTAACEADFNPMSGWSSNIALDVSTPILVNVTRKARNAGFLTHLARDRYHDLPGERRPARARPTNGRTRVSANHQAL
jgi:hypothetical protein